MAISRTNPISLDVLATDVPPESLDTQIQELIKKVEQVDFDMLPWLRKQSELYRLRMGNRRGKTVPWKNSANVSIPLIDGLIRRWKPGITSLVLDAEPIAFFTAQENTDETAARLVEQFFTWLFRENMDTTYATVQLADLIAWRGHAYSREGWDYRTRREARIVSAEKLFPGGLQAFLQQAQAEAQAAGQQINPLELVASRLIEEYDLDPSLPQEAAMLQEVATRLLQGAPFVRLVSRVVEKDRPKWDVIDPINVIVPQDQDPETAEFFCIIHMLTEDELRAMGRDGHLPSERVEKLIEEGAKTTSPVGSGTSDSERDRLRDLADERSGRTQRQSERDAGLFTVWEIYAHLDINGDGERERVILWYAPRESRSIALLEYPYPFDSWPITYYPFEAAKRPIDNRGLADMVKVFQRLVNAYHNARIDASQIVLAPVLLQRSTGGNFKKNIKWHPGAIIPVQNTNDIVPLQQDLSILQALSLEEQANRREAETYVGVFDAALTNLADTRERRTAAEVNAIQALSSSIFGLDAKIFQVAFSKSLTKIWQVWEDLGPEETFFRVQGEEQPKLARKSEIMANYDIRASGTPANTNRSLQINNIERLMQLLLQPLIIQTGQVNISTLIEKWAQLIDFNLAKGIVRGAEEGAAAQLIMQGAQQISAESGEKGNSPLVI